MGNDLIINIIYPHFLRFTTIKDKNAFLYRLIHYGILFVVQEESINYLFRKSFFLIIICIPKFISHIRNTSNSLTASFRPFFTESIMHQR